ncbi:MAG TPA: kelch repeat-containing protein [Iamia sp.]|nr:kelch repeat-containing protein [Iamia sp.]
MSDPIAALRRAADAVTAADLTPDPVAAVRARVAARRTRRRLPLAAVAAALVVLAGTAVVLAGGDGAPDEDVLVSPSTTTPRPSDDEVPRSPLQPRHQVALAAVGDEVVVWGGLDATGAALADGAAYDRSTGTWRVLAPAPLTGGEAGAVAAPVAGGVVIARGTDVARWDQATDTWTTLDNAPRPVTDLTAVGPDRVASIAAGAVLDVGTGTWAEPGAGPPFDLDPGVTAVAWTGEELIAVGTSADGDPARPYSLAFDPEAVSWRDMAVAPPADHLGSAGLRATWDGRRVVVTDATLRTVAYDPAADTWAPLQAVPDRLPDTGPATAPLASVDGVTVAATTNALSVLDAEDGTWTPYPAPAPGLRPVAVDDTTLGAWVDDAGPDRPDLVLVDPATLAGQDRRPIGPVALTLGPDDRVVNAARNGSDGRVVVLVEPGPERGTCRIESGFPRPPGSAEQRAVEEEVTVVSGPKVWFHDAAGAHWETEIGDQDLVTVDCPDPAAARRLVAALDLTPGG